MTEQKVSLQPTICENYGMGDGNFSNYLTKTQNEGFVVCNTDQYWLDNFSSSEVDFLITGTWIPPGQQGVPIPDWICPSDPKDKISEIPRQYVCSKPNTVPCISQPNASNTININQGTPSCPTSFPKNNNSGITCSVGFGQPCQCGDNVTMGPSNCYQVQNACVPAPPPASIEQLSVYKSTNPTLYNQNLQVAAQCCVGEIIAPNPPIAPPTCGIGLCGGGSNCPSVMTAYCSDPNSIINNSICRKYVNTPSGTGGTDKNTKRELLSSFLESNLTKYIENGGIPDNNPNNRAILETCTNSVITDGDNSVCTALLKPYCSKVQATYDQIELGLNNKPVDELTQLCGCFLSTYPYDGIVSSECQAICLSSPLNQNSCTSSVCLLDINITNTIIDGGEIIINDVCPSPQRTKSGTQDESVQTSNLICNFTAQGYNNIVKTKNSIDFKNRCSECRLINKDESTTMPVSCPVFGGSAVTNCSSDSDCGSGQVCQEGICIQGQTSWTWEYILIIGGGLFLFVIVIFVIFLIIRRNRK